MNIKSDFNLSLVRRGDAKLTFSMEILFVERYLK